MTDTLPNGNDPAVPAGESTDEFDYESLFNEHEQAQTSQPKPEPAPRSDPATRQLIEEFKPIAQYASANMQREAEQREKEVVEQAVSAVKEDGSLSTVSDTIVEAYLNLQYVRDPAFKAAFEGRTENPDSWNNALGKARESLSADISQVGKFSDRDDTAAALATVRGTSQTEIDDALDVKPKDLFAMSDQDFRAFKSNLDS